MKLRNLNGAIRKVEGPVTIKLRTGDGVLEISVVKSNLIDNLKGLYGEDNTVETSLTIENGYLAHEDGTPFGDPIASDAPQTVADLDEALDDEADLLGDEPFDAVKDASYGADDELDLLS